MRQQLRYGPDGEPGVGLAPGVVVAHVDGIHGAPDAGQAVPDLVGAVARAVKDEGTPRPGQAVPEEFPFPQKGQHDKSPFRRSRAAPSVPARAARGVPACLPPL